MLIIPSQPLEAVDPRVKVLPVGGYEWDSYLVIDEMELLKDVAKLAWGDGGSCHHLEQSPLVNVNSQYILLCNLSHICRQVSMENSLWRSCSEAYLTDNGCSDMDVSP